MTTQYEDRPNTGKILTSKEKKSDSSPDVWGYVKFDADYLRQISDGEHGLVEVKLSGWKKQSASGNNYISLAVNTGSHSASKPVVSNGKDPWDE